MSKNRQVFILKEVTSDNPCAACSIGQDCCTNLAGLRLSKAEFERNFLRHHESLLVKEHSGIYEVAGRRNVCPNWGGNRCTVYETRPIECRIFPYTIGDVVRIGRLVVLTYHHRTRCPQKLRLLAPRTEVVDMLVSFAHDAFGRDLRVLVVPDIFPFRFASLLRRVPRKMARAVGKATHGAGH